MKTIRIVVLAGVTVAALAGCGTAGEATMAGPTTPTDSPTSTSALVTTTPAESAVTATVIVTAAPAVAPVTVTAPPPVVSTVTQIDQPPVIVVPDPTTVYQTSYYGQYSSVGALPDGLYCRDLKAMGFSFSEAITYWNYQGQPSRMDLDLNGIPCETVY